MDALDIILVTAKMIWLGQQVQNVFHLFGDAPLDDTDALNDIEEYMEALYTFVQPRMSDNLTFDSIVAQNLTAGTLMGERSWPTLTTGGLGVSGSLPSQVAGLITLPTAVPKRRGRKFVPGFNENDLTNGLFISALTDALEDFGAYLLSGHSMGSGTGWWYRVVSPTLGLGSASVPTAVVVTNVPSTLSRRRIGAGA